MSNLKQIGLGVMMYVQDYDEKYPSSYLITAQTPPDGVQWSAGVWFWQQIIYPYTKSGQIYYCPSGVSLPSSYHGPYIFNYGASQFIFTGYESAVPTHPAGTPGPTVSMASVNSPASTYMLMDSGGYDPWVPRGVLYVNGWRYLPGAHKVAGIACLTGQVYTQDCEAEGRHFDGLNVAFADGHVKWLKSATVIREAQKYNAATHAESAWDPKSS